MNKTFFMWTSSFFFSSVTQKKKGKKSGGETSSSPAGESWGGNQIAAATVWHSSVITVKSVFFLWKASFHSQIFPMFESWVPVPTKWLLAWKWKPPWRGPLKWFAKWGRFSHKVVTFSKIRSSAVPNYGVCVNWSAPLGDETLHLFVAVVICVAAVIIFYRKPAFWCGRKKTGRLCRCAGILPPQERSVNWGTVWGSLRTIYLQLEHELHMNFSFFISKDIVMVRQGWSFHHWISNINLGLRSVLVALALISSVIRLQMSDQCLDSRCVADFGTDKK